MSREPFLFLQAFVGERTMPAIGENAWGRFPGYSAPKTAPIEVGSTPSFSGQQAQNSARKLGSVARRGFDAISALLGLLVLSPVFAIIAAIIKCSDGGPVFYGQMRVGKDFRMFRLIKFRSMVPNSAGVTLLTGPDDPRVTFVGRFLRKWKLDELPQLINVLKGEMQLVGVRPQTERFVQAYPFEYSVLLREPPGITDLASLTYRNEEGMFQPGSIEEQYINQILPEKLQLALKYRGTRTFISDLEIIFRTVLGLKSPAMLR